MSNLTWQSYIPSLLAQGALDKAAIFDSATKELSGISDGFELTDAERASILSAFADPGAAQTNGLRIGGTKFIINRLSDTGLYAKQLPGHDGIVVAKLNRMIIVGHYSATGDTSSTATQAAVNRVEGIREYLAKSGY